MSALKIHPVDNSPGFFRASKVRYGAQLPCRFWVEEIRDEETGERIADDKFFAEMGVEQIDPFCPPGWPYSWRAIDENEWRFLYDNLLWCLEHEPTGPQANADRPARTVDRILF